MKIYLSVVIGILAAAAGVNLFFDPVSQGAAQAFPIPPRRLQPGEIWFSGGAANEINMRAYFIRTDRASQIITLGSSRAWRISSDSFAPGVGMLNLSISGCRLEHLIGLWQMIKQTNRRPLGVVMLVDPWLIRLKAHDEAVGLGFLQGPFSEFMGQPSSVSMHRQAAQIGIQYTKAVNISLRDLLDWNRLKANLHALAQRNTRSSAPAIDKVENLQTGSKGVRWDGAMVYPEYQESNEEQRRRVIKNITTPGFMTFNGWTTGAREQQLLEKLLRDMSASGAALLLVLPPYHPWAYRMLTQHPDYAQSLQQYRDVTARLARSIQGAEIYDFVDPGSVGCTESDFDDATHPRDACVDKIIRTIRLRSVRWRPWIPQSSSQ